jgi:hypothetical protein
MIPTARVFPIPNFIFKGSLVDPRMRASNEHILIVRVPRAGGRPGYPTSLFSILLNVIVPARYGTDKQLLKLFL